MNKILPYIKLARPHQWIKNVVVLFPVMFGLKMYQPQAWIDALLAALAFCLGSSFVYIINDIVDAPADRKHPYKKNRPIASGKVSAVSACLEGLIFLLCTAALCFAVNIAAVTVLAIYLLLQVAYTLVLKRLVLIDVICISIGFVLRAVAGAVAISVWVSPWLFICMFTIFLFMGFCKRMNEIVLFEDVQAAQKHRKTLIEYTPNFLTHLITTSAGIAIVAFLSYSQSDSTVQRFGTSGFAYTLPIMVYGIFRFAMLSMKGVYSGPTEIILKDRPFGIAVTLWIAAAAALILFGENIENFLSGMS